MGEGTEQEKFTVNQEIKEYAILNVIVHPDLNLRHLVLSKSAGVPKSFHGLLQIGAR